MFLQNKSEIKSDGSIIEKRRHPRKTVFKSAFIYPVLQHAGLTVTNVSAHGLSGETALTLSLREQVHVGFNDRDFITAEVRWTNGFRVGLLAEDPLLWTTGNDVLLEHLADSHRPREGRVPVNIAATLVTSAPVMVGTIRNISAEGMLIEVGNVREGTRLLIKSRGNGTRMGRVQWISGGMAGVFFEQGV
ncbi:PilZ domain-containing protein [Sphingobium sp. LMA1-1-1.1]|jgi:hypothetical protein|uniref:PilZ domain-containing protein n=1 Tax=unclassified Sphingobium TaxID=2611147 RepID=UPI0034468704